MPVPIETKTKLANSLPWPCSRSASAAASVSFSTARFSPNAPRRPASTAGLSQPAIPPVSVIVRDVRRRADPVGEPDQLGHALTHARRGAARLGLGPDLAGQIGDRAAQVLVADVQAEHVAGVRPYLVEHRGPAGNPGSL